MTDDQERQLIRESHDGAQAAHLLDSAVYKAAMQKVEDGILAAWKDSPIRDTEGQHYLRLMLKCLTDLRGHIKDVAQTGKMAEVQLERERTIAERLKDGLRRIA